MEVKGIQKLLRKRARYKVALRLMREVSRMLAKPEKKTLTTAEKRILRGLPLPTRAEPELCECCGKKQKKTMNLDHDHITGNFRGWLCSNCNAGIGILGDNIQGLENAINYLKKNS